MRTWIPELNAWNHGARIVIDDWIGCAGILGIFCDAKSNRELVLGGGRLLKDMCKAKFNRDFPKPSITMNFPLEYADDLLQYEASFFQER